MRGRQGLSGVSDVAVSPDKHNVYVASYSSGAIAEFSRAGEGELTQTGCVSWNGTDGTGGVCTVDASLGSPEALAVTDKQVFAVGHDVMNVFDRGAGGLAPVSCVKDGPSLGGCVDGRGLSLANDVTVSPDGLNVYVAASSGAVAVFDALNGTFLGQKGVRPAASTRAERTTAPSAERSTARTR